MLPPTPKAWALLAILLILGCVGNYAVLPLFFGADFIFGSIAVLIVLQFFGLRWGLLAALLANSFTYFLWGHPYAFIIFSLEALFVGYWLRRGRKNLVLLDGLFWLLAGMPLAYCLYALVLHLGPMHGLFIGLKQSVNGVFNALLASLVIYHLSLGRFLEPRPCPRTTSLRETLLNLSVAVMLVPALIIMLVNSREEVKKSEADIIRRMELASADIAGQLFFWHQQSLRAVTELAHLAANTSLAPSPALQHDTQVVDKATPAFRSMFVTDAQGITISYSPAQDAQGHSNIGLNYADLHHFQEVQITRRPVLSGVFMGRAIPSPVAALVVPIFTGEQFRGMAVGSLDLHRLQAMLQPFGQEAHLDITLIDSLGQIVVSTVSDRKPMMLWTRPGGTVQPIRAPVYQWFPGDPKLPAMARWKNSLLVLERHLSNLPWKMVVEAPCAPLQGHLYLIYVRHLAIMAGLTVLFLVIAGLFSRWLVRPLTDLALVTRDLPGRLAAHQDFVWPASSATEFQVLVTNFRAMARTLTSYIQNLQKANVDLAAEIEARARVEAALRESEGRYRLLADNARDVIWRLDPNHQFTYLSPSTQLLIGFSAETAMDLGLAGIMTPASFQLAQDAILRMETRELQEQPAVPPSETLELEMIHKNGSTVWGEVHASLLRDSQGQAAGFMGVARDITARRTVEAALAAEATRRRILIEQSRDGIVILDDLGKVVEANGQFADMLGYALEAVYDLHVWDWDAHWSREELEEQIRSIDAAGDHFETRHRRKDGTVFDVDISTNAAIIAEQKLIFCACRDISQRKAMEAALRESEARLRLAVEAAAGGPWDWDIATDGFYLSPEFLHNFGYDPEPDEKVAGTLSFWEAKIHPDDRPAYSHALQAHLGGQTPSLECEFRGRVAGGQYRWFLSRCRVVQRDPDGTPIRMLGSLTDITDNKLTRAALEESLSLYQAILESTADGILVVNLQGQIVSWNQKFREMWGIPLDILDTRDNERVKQYVLDQFHEPHNFLARAEELFLHPEREQYDIFSLKDGRVFERYSIPQHRQDQIVGRVLSFRDVTGRVRAEEALRQSEQRFRQMAETIGEVFWMAPPDNQSIIYVSPGFEQVWGRPCAALHANPRLWLEAIHAEDVPKVARALENLLLSQPYDEEYRITRPDGAVRWINDRGYPVRDGAGQIIFTCGVASDITARKQVEETLAQQSQFLQLLIDTIPTPIFYKDEQGRFLDCNQAYQAFYGLARDELAGKTLEVLGSDALADKYRQMDQELFRHPGLQSYESLARRRDGTTRDVVIKKATFFKADGTVGGLIGVFTDITEVKQAENQLRALAMRLAQIQEMERQNLARDLHDQVCQNLASMGLTLETLKIRVIKEPPERLLDRLADTARLVEQTGEVVRELMEGLRPTSLQRYGLLEGLRRCVKEFSQRTGIDADIQGEEAAPRLAAPVELALFRITQEALSNVARHAHASRVVLTEAVDDSSVRLVIDDNGVGFDPTQVMQPEGRHRWGLMTMSERALAVGGRCHIESQAGQGTQVIVEVDRKIVSAD
jgi:PAS domain S-box-containing protein